MSPTSRALLGVTAALCAVAVAWFSGRQERAPTLGGRISAPKRVWLAYAVWFWLFECAVLAFDGQLPWGLRVVVGVQAASMWARGAVEMVMLYVTKNWRPPLGIAHDVLCLVTTLALAVVYRGQLATGAIGWWGPGLVALLVTSLVAEIVYAALFFRAVEGRTTGDDAVWFAADDAKFARINRLTTALNVPQLVAQVAFVWWA